MSSLAHALRAGDPSIFGPGTSVVFVRPYRTGRNHIQAGVTGTIETVLPRLEIRIDEAFYVSNANRMVEVDPCEAEDHLTVLGPQPLRTQWISFDSEKV